MRTNFLITTMFISTILCSGCWSPNYNKIPLQTSDVPYILADGDYMDNKGNLHPNQHDVWAMSQADVFDYMKYIRNLSAKTPTHSSNLTFLQRIRQLPLRLTKNHVIYALIAMMGVVISIALVLRSKLRKAKKSIGSSESEA